MRIGSGGVMLPHYSPFKVAETFSLLAGLFPGRIDLGIGRAAGTDPMTTFALQRDRRVDCDLEVAGRDVAVGGGEAGTVCHAFLSRRRGTIAAPLA